MQPDRRLCESLRFGFEREGVVVAACEPGDSFDQELFAEPAEIVIAGGRTGEEARAILSLVRGVLAAVSRQPPVLYVGNAIGRSQALAEGATEFFGQPVYVRDAVTVAKLLAGRKRDNPSVLTGELGEHFGLFYLVRAISALGRRGVLTLVRGLRRGELRFFDGEVTSAQVGLLHGMAALHQLLLWTEGRFELRPEDVVRRQQIPLEPTELFAEADRFLTEICAVAGNLSPSACYERDDRQVGRVAGRIPAEVTSVLHLFDGVRTVADVVEDCQYRVFETLRIANRLCELGLIRLRFASRPRHTAHAALAIEEWLIGDKASRETEYVLVDEAVGPAGADEPAAESGPGQGGEGDPQRSRRRRGSAWRVVEATPDAGPDAARERRVGESAAGEGAATDAAAWEDRGAGDERREPAAGPGERGEVVSGLAKAGEGSMVVDWEQLLPGAIGNELSVSPVVPSAVAAGEISVAGASREPRASVVLQDLAVPAVRAAGETMDQAVAATPVSPVEAAGWRADGAPAPGSVRPEPTKPGKRLAPSTAAASAAETTTPRAPDTVLPGETAGAAVAVLSAEGPQVAAPARSGEAPREEPGRPPVESAPAAELSAGPERMRPAGTSPPEPSRTPSKPPVFSASEEAFFARGHAPPAEPGSETFDDLEERVDLSRSFWRRLFRRASRRPAAAGRGNQPRRRR